jgi:hypothetical protein
MFGTSAEVLAGLQKTFKDYAQKNEAAWRRPEKGGDEGPARLAHRRRR